MVSASEWRAVQIRDRMPVATQGTTEPLFTIDFSSDHSLRPVFDAGLRPKNIRGLELVTCELRNKRIAFILEGGTRVVIYAQSVQFTVHRDDNIGDVLAITDSLSIEDAFAVATQPYTALNGTRTELRGALNIIALNPSLAYLENVGKRQMIGKADVGVGFLRGPYVKGLIEKPLRLAISIVWKETRHGVAVREKAIEPPVGYRHLSMNPE